MKGAKKDASLILNAYMSRICPKAPSKPKPENTNRSSVFIGVQDGITKIEARIDPIKELYIKLVTAGSP